MHDLKKAAAQKKKTMSELVETALRNLLYHQEDEEEVCTELPSFHGGKPMINIADRDALYSRMES